MTRLLHTPQDEPSEMVLKRDESYHTPLQTIKIKPHPVLIFKPM
jgi:hypothetical protein